MQPIRFQVIEGIPVDTEILNGIVDVNVAIFKSSTAAGLLEQLSKRHALLIVVAMDGTRVAGYKIGYEQNQSQFHSWLGGVHPEYRKQGIASEMMRLQHNWCREHGYTSIRTHTKNKWREMLILNIRNGFDVVGTVTEDGLPKIILEKTLV